jgi:hypothetical protein
MQFRPKFTYANVVSTLALLIALGGASYAAIKLPKNSVGTKQLKKNSVTTAKIKNGAVNGAKVKNGTLTGAQINVSTLGTVPSAQTAQSATVANSLPPAEPWHEVGAPGEPAFNSNWENVGSLAPHAGFFKDQLGMVHLRGEVKSTGEELPIFKLPPGFRLSDEYATFIGYCFNGAFCGSSGVEQIEVLGGDYSPSPQFSGAVTAYPAAVVNLNGITFRAES